jgi:hypothetical protein
MEITLEALEALFDRAYVTSSDRYKLLVGEDLTIHLYAHRDSLEITIQNGHFTDILTITVPVKTSTIVSF